MISDAAHTAMTATSGGIATFTTPASLAVAGEAFLGLPNHLVVTHILRSGHFDNPADLARLPAVSRTMRDAVAETGLRFEELDEKRAVELGCLSAVQRLQRRGLLSRQEYLCEAAARSGQLKKLKALRAYETPWDMDTFFAAASGGHLDVLQWLRAIGCPWSANTCASAAYGGHLEVLQWLRANGCPCNADRCSRAAGGGHLQVLQRAHANGCPWDLNTCTGAARGGHLEVLQGVRANGCPWDQLTCAYAAQGGHFEALQWLRANGFLWDFPTCSRAAKGGHLELRGPAVGADERLPVGLAHAPCCIRVHTGVGGGERRTRTVIDV